MVTSSTWIATTFVRGGTSKGLFFTDSELPLEIASPEGACAGVSGELARRDAVLSAALGSPDPFGRQLDGMGGGVSSLSKAVIVGRSRRAGIDLDYTFAQVSVTSAIVDYSGNCGNLSSGVVPFALSAGLISRPDGLQRFSLHNTNTNKVVNVRLMVEGGQSAVRGDLSLPGVAGTGSAIELAYPEPGGSRTQGTLPTGLPAEVIEGSGRSVRVSIVDATIPLVLVLATEIGLNGAELPAVIESRGEVMALLEELRRAAAVRAGLCADAESAPHAVPKVVIVSRAAEAVLLSGETQAADAADLLARTISMGQVHGAVPGTGAMCTAAAALIPGTVVAELFPAAQNAQELTRAIRIGTPSGVVTASAMIAAAENASARDIGSPRIVETALVRTARILMRGQVAIGLG